jgi:hypothetical protein
MKLNKWTIGLAALGLVSLSPGVRAQSTTAPAPAAIPLTTALSATVISGYVDTSAIWVPGTGDAHPAPVEFNTPQKQDGFNLDAADVKIARAPDTSNGPRVTCWNWNTARMRLIRLREHRFGRPMWS